MGGGRGKKEVAKERKKRRRRKRQENSINQPTSPSVRRVPAEQLFGRLRQEEQLNL